MKWFTNEEFTPHEVFDEMHKETENLSAHYASKVCGESSRTFTVSDENAFEEYVEDAISYAVSCMNIVKYEKDLNHSYEIYSKVKNIMGSLGENENCIFDNISVEEAEKLRANGYTISDVTSDKKRYKVRFINNNW